MKTRSILSLMFGLLLCVASSFGQSFNFVSIDVPCSPAPPTNCANSIAPQTVAKGVNAAGDIVGAYVDGAGQHGFLLQDGHFFTINVPGSVAGVAGTLPTVANGIGPSGDIVGQYVVPVHIDASDPALFCPAAGNPACIKGFFYRGGKFSTVLFPGHPGAIAQRISPNGDIYGCLHDLDLGPSMFGAIWSRFNTSSLIAGGGELADASQSLPMSMNNGATPSGHLVIGLWVDMGGHQHGLQVQDGTYSTYDPPGSTATAIWDINPGQQFVGTYVSGGVRHGFLQLPDASVPTNVDFPGAAATIAWGINSEGVIVGQYTRSGVIHGFVAVRTDI